MSRLGLLLFLFVLLLALPQAAMLPLLDRDEPRFAEASREMLQSGNIVVPTFNHAPRYAKPPLIYWCQSLSYCIFGQNAFAARLPSLLATAGTAWLIFVWCVRLGSVQIGFSAAVCYALCFQAIQQGRVATADALLIFFMTLTAFAGWQLINSASSGKERFLRNALLILGIAGGFLAKGPEALLPVLVILWCARGVRNWLLTEIIFDLVIGLALVALWAIPAYIQTNGDYWRIGLSEGVGERMVSGLQGHGASNPAWYIAGLFYYVLLFWISALPWSPLLITQRKKLFTNWKRDSADTYLLLNAGLIFLVFTLMVTKLPHYTLPAFPFLALLFARRWQSAGLSPHYLTKVGWRIGIIFAIVALIGIPIAMKNDASPSPVGVLVKKAGDLLTPETQFALIDYHEPSAIWEMRRVVKPYEQPVFSLALYGATPPEVKAYLNQPGPHAVIMPTEKWQIFEKVIPPEANWTVIDAQGINGAKIKIKNLVPSLEPLDLTMVLKP